MRLVISSAIVYYYSENHLDDNSICYETVFKIYQILFFSEPQPSDLS